MFHIQGMPHSEISKILRVSEGTVRSRLFYANRQLQNYLDEFRKNPVGLTRAEMDEFNDNEIGKLLRLKRYEQPPPGYFEISSMSFHRRQRDDCSVNHSGGSFWERTQDFIFGWMFVRSPPTQRLLPRSWCAPRSFR